LEWRTIDLNGLFHATSIQDFVLAEAKHVVELLVLEAAFQKWDVEAPGVVPSEEGTGLSVSVEEIVVELQHVSRVSAVFSDECWRESPRATLGHVLAHLFDLVPEVASGPTLKQLRPVEDETTFLLDLTTPDNAVPDLDRKVLSNFDTSGLAVESQVVVRKLLPVRFTQEFPPHRNHLAHQPLPCSSRISHF
jgi:hypothetical protein